MIKNRFLAAVMAVLAGVSVISCDEIQEVIDKVIEVSISSDNDAFSASGEAVVKLSLNAPSNKDINVILGVSAEAQSGFTAVSSDALVFEGSVTIPAGTDLVPVTVKLNDKAKAGQQAVITIASANGASVGKDAVVYLKVPAEYSNENNPGGGDEKPNLAGANVWAIIGAFNNWAGDVELTKTNDSPEEWKITGCPLGGEFKFRGNKEWGDYDLGAAQGAQIAFGEPLTLIQRGQNITIADGVYDIVLYPTELKAVFSPVSSNGPVFRSDWSGSLYMASYTAESGDKYAVIETTGFADTEYYDMWYVTLPAEGLANLDAAALLAKSKSDIDEAYNYYKGEYPYTDFLYNGEDYWLVYPEITESGEYVVFFVGYNTDGSLTNDYGYSTFSYTAPDVVDVTANLREDWYAQWDGWDPGNEGEYFWVTGSAKGADYIYAEWFTDDEIEEYYGDINGMVSDLATQVRDYVAEGKSLEDALYPVDADGSFESYLDTYEEVGPVNVYIIGFSADGTCVGDYGVSEVVIPEVEKPVINWEEKTDWKVAYDSTVDTEDARNPYAIVVSACDAEYFDVAIGYAGALEEYGLDGLVEKIGDWSGSINQGYTMDDLVEMGYVGTPETLPFIYAADDLEEGDELYVFGYDANGAYTGAWAMGIAENVVHPDPIEMTLQTEWSVRPVGAVYQEDEDDVIDVEVVAPGIKYYIAEENTQEDLDYYYGGTISGMAEYKQDDIQLYIDFFDASVAELIYSAEDPQTSIYVYNTDVETTIYLLEFDENGLATGRYGATTVVIPSVEGASAPAKVKVRVKKLNAQKSLDRKPVVSNKPVLEDKQHRTKVNTASVKFGAKNAAVRTFEGTRVVVKR